MAVGIQHVQASQLIEISSPSTGGMAILKDKKNGRTLTLNVVHGPGAGHSLPLLQSMHQMQFFGAKFPGLSL
jgi:hypothetical protein